jgi:hypothetical protein
MVNYTSISDKPATRLSIIPCYLNISKKDSFLTVKCTVHIIVNFLSIALDHVKKQEYVICPPEILNKITRYVISD